MHAIAYYAIKMSSLLIKYLYLLIGMHRKSIEAAHHLKEDGCTTSDHEETQSLRTDTSETSGTSSNHQSSDPPASSNSQQQTCPTRTGPTQSTKETSNPSGTTQLPPQQPYQEDPEIFRNQSIACLRAKAQEHSAKLLNHGLMLQVRSLANMGQSTQANCDANANNLPPQSQTHHQQEVVNPETSPNMF